MKLCWKYCDNFITAQTKNFKYKTKLAMFDLDKTLVIPKIGKRGFPIDENDWKFIYDNVVDKIRQLSVDHSIMIISNQKGISTGKQPLDGWSHKLNDICNVLNVNLCIFASIKNNKYRKPNSLWLFDLLPNNVNMFDSFYCGDACGRVGDFSDTDYKFALNCMTKFFTPEQLFLERPEVVPPVIYPNLSKVKKYNITIKPRNKEIIIMVGFPGSGKSYVANMLSNKFGYYVVNQDTVGTYSKCVKIVMDHILNNRAVIIDSTNKTKQLRKNWISLANKNGYSARIIHVVTDRHLSKHNNYYRNITSGRDIIPEVVYRTYNKYFEFPSADEGASDIINMECGRPDDILWQLYLY
jgi:bifunctional polynucleotide phosphatase/kinase